MRTGNTTIHVEFNDEVLHPTQENPEGKHFYFGSITAIYDAFTRQDIGAGKRTLYDHNLSPENPFVGKNCTIRKGSISRKETNRKPPVKILRVVY